MIYGYSIQPTKSIFNHLLSIGVQLVTKDTYFTFRLYHQYTTHKENSVVIGYSFLNNRKVVPIYKHFQAHIVIYTVKEMKNFLKNLFFCMPEGTHIECICLKKLEYMKN